MLRLPVLVALLVVALSVPGAGTAPAVAAGAEPGELTLDLAAESTHLTCLDQSRIELGFAVEIGSLAAREVFSEAGTFTRLVLPGFHSSQTPGAPALPLLNRLITVPAGAEARIEIESVQGRKIDLAAAGLDHLLWPAQPSRPKDVAPEDWPFVFDRTAYAVAEVSRAPVAVVPVGSLRGVNLARLEVSPVVYFPQQGQIQVTESLSFRIVFESAAPAGSGERQPATWSPFFAHLHDGLPGAAGLQDDFPDLVGDVVTMVIITPPQFSGQLQEFSDWKTERGFHVVLGEIGSPAVGSTAASIQAFIHDLYLQATPELPAPSFALFVGDIDLCPTFFVNGYPTDRPYCAVDGDLVPDIYYGRLSAANPEQLQAILDKTLQYDRFLLPDPSYLAEVVMIAGMDPGHAAVWGNGQINYGTTHYFNPQHGIDSHTYLFPMSGGSAGQILQNLGDGVALVNYTGHGGPTAWLDPYVGQAEVIGLDNRDRYCLAVVNGCHTGAFHNGECLAETWLRAEDRGAIGYIGAAAPTYWDEDYWWSVGYAGIVAEPTYADSGPGAFDGLFHDHGEPEHSWYVTNGALLFAGNLAVLESGSARIETYWNIYNLMGDPSLSAYLGVPAANPVSHPASLFTTDASVTVAAEPGSYIGLTQAGDIVGAGTVGLAGSAEIPLASAGLVPGVPLHLVVTAQNRRPYLADLAVTVPTAVSIQPATIGANDPTLVTVTVLAADGVSPWPGVRVWAEGFAYQTTPVLTDGNGRAQIVVDYPYGPTLDLMGQDPQGNYRLFTEQVAVGAADLTGPDLSVSTDTGLGDSFALNLPGILTATVGETGAVVGAILPDGGLATTESSQLEITPATTGTVTGIIAVSGYDLYRETFETVPVYGTLSGTVTAAGYSLAGAELRGYDGGGDLAFQAETDSSGFFAVPGDLLVADYTIALDAYGYLSREEPFFLGLGPNLLAADLAPAPGGFVFGTITAAGGEPLQAIVEVRRSDTGEVVGRTTSDPADGSFSTPVVPYFPFDLQVRTFGYLPLAVGVAVTEPAVEKHFVLTPTGGGVLVIDDNGPGGAVIVKYDPKGQSLLAPGYEAAAGSAAEALREALAAAGFPVLLEPAAATDPASWPTYDLVVVSCGGNPVPLADGDLRAALLAFVDGGGHLLIEGGELANDYFTDPDFAARVLHLSGWAGDEAGDLVAAAPDHPLLNLPEPIPGPLALAPAGYGDLEAVEVFPDAVLVCADAADPKRGAVVAFDPDPGPAGGQIVFFAFNYVVMDPAGSGALLRNAARWLTTAEDGTARVTGRVTLRGLARSAGVLVQAVPGGDTAVTGPDGAFSLDMLFAGSYRIVASRAGWSTVVREVTLGEGQQLTDLDLLLAPAAACELGRTPQLAIPDSLAAGVSDAVTVLDAGEVGSVEVFLDLGHTYVGDLVVTLTSPAGTTAVLHGRTSGTANYISGWYPADLAPVVPLTGFLGEQMQGEWTLTVADVADFDVGTLASWRLRITYGEPAIWVTDDVPPAVVTLGRNHPNPFNPATRISFGLPTAGPIDLAVFDLCGRRVATLRQGFQPAGRHEVVWNGTDQAGRAVASGVYIYRLAAAAATLTGKMLLLR